LLRLQELDLRIEALKARALEIPKQKGRFDIHRKRLAAELAEREKTCKNLAIEQRECEIDMEQKQAQVRKYEQQLFSVKKNEEYQALLHEIDMIKKQIGLKEERIIAIMVELDESKARLEEDRKRIHSELTTIEDQCERIDAEFEETVRECAQLEREREPVLREVNADLLTRYTRIRTSKKGGPAVVALAGEVCSGCHMHVPPQVVNEILAGQKLHACSHCGRLLYDRGNFENAPADPAGQT
jgi:hypothetical protein